MDSKADVSIQKKLALALEKAKAKLLHYNESIAIIGMSCTFPGAPNLEAFWNLLQKGQDGIQDIPASRWDIHDYYDSDPDAPGKMITKKGGFIQDIEKFDAFFFNISPREAEALDPQQRLLLEQTWYALEHAGIAARDLRGSDTGVFIGIATQDYRDLIIEHGDLRNINAYFGSGNALSTATGRLSYTLGLQGPNIAIETACSSSLVALHEACKSLQRSECTLAITGGVNALLAPGLFVNFSKAGMLSPDGHCKTFDEKANGYVRGEGCGILILKRLSEALQDNDTILAIVKATGINQDGASSGLTVPNGEAQEKLLKRVLSESKLKAIDVDYIECHGTGTSLGDPIEVHALGEVYGRDRTPEKPLLLGSVKTNIGHLEAAAGVAGLIKSVLALQHRELPKNLHFQTLNPHIELNFPGTILTKNTQWQSQDLPRHAAVSAFGFSGTNAHVILEEAPIKTIDIKELALPEACLFVVSAKTESALRALLLHYIDYLEHTKDSLFNICYTSSTGREHFPFRMACVVKDKKELISRLQSHDQPFMEVKLSSELISTDDLLLQQQAYFEGKSIDFKGYYAPYKNALSKVVLPGYCFDKQKYWIDLTFEKTTSLGLKLHPLLGTKLPGYSEEIRFINELNINQLSYLKDHLVYGNIIYPAAGFIESICACVFNSNENPVISVSDIEFQYPLSFGDNTQIEYQVSFKEHEGQIYSHHLNNADWVKHVCFKLNPQYEILSSAIDLKALKQDWQESSLDHFYSSFQQQGLAYGSAFQTVKKAWIKENKALIEVSLNDLNSKEYFLHPTLLDGLLQSMILLVSKELKNAYLPMRAGTLALYQKAGSSLVGMLELKEHTSEFIKTDISLYNEEGLLIGILYDVIAKQTSEQAFKKLLSSQLNYELYQEHYEVHSLPTMTPTVALELLELSSKENSLPETSGRHVVYAYDEHAFMHLVHTAQHLLEHRPKSFTLLLNHAVSINDQDRIEPKQTQALGFFKSFIQESGFPCYVIDGDSSKAMDEVMPLIIANTLDEHQIILRDTVYVPRLMTRAMWLAHSQLLSVPGPDDYLVGKQGIDEIHFEERAHKALAPHDIRLAIRATGLNFRDVMKAMNLYPGEAGDFGYECSAVVLEVGSDVKSLQQGDDVIVCGQGLMASEAVVSEYQVAIKPDTLSFAQAAGIPIVFLTVNYALNQLVKLKKGQKILIHAASGGVGMAAIQYAQWKGADIYATASQSKLQYLKETFGIEHLYDSRSLDFGLQILADTQNEGVDVVLNSLTSEGFIAASLSCLKNQGTFIEIGKLNIYSKEDMKKARPDVEYHIIEIDKRIEEEPQDIHEELLEIVHLFNQGKLKTLPMHCFDVIESRNAFHFLRQAKHKGKVVITYPQPFTYKENATYLITGISSKLMLELANHLIDKGVRHLRVISRKEPEAELKAWMFAQTAKDVTIIHHQVSVADNHAMKAVFKEIEQTKIPLKGIFHGAGVLKDGLLMNLKDSDFERVLEPKITGSEILHELSQHLNLDCFVLFSSITATLGNLGQSNYSAANAFMDGLVKQRHQHQLPGISINFGPFADSGMAQGLGVQHSALGFLSLDAVHVFEHLESMFMKDISTFVLARIEWKKIELIGLKSYLKYFLLDKGADTHGFIERLKSTDEEKRKEIIRTHLKIMLADVLGIQDVSLINNDKGFFELGIDSLMAVELKNRLQELIGSTKMVRNTAFFDYSSINKMMTYLLEELLADELSESVDLSVDFLDKLEEEFTNLSTGDSHDPGS